MGKKIAILGLVLLAVFLAGFIPQHSRRVSAETELAGGELRDLVSLAYFQASQKNYGLAAQTSTQFFSRVQQMEGPAYQEILGYRDKITAELAKGDAAAISDLQTLYLKTRAATGR